MSIVPRPARVAVLGVLVALCACGAAIAASPSLSSFLLRSHEQPGYVITRGTHKTQRSAAAYAKWAGVSSADQNAYAERLKKAGFVKATDEQLHGRKSRQGFSLVVVFKHHAGAKELAGILIKNAYSEQQGAKLRSFKVPGVSSARGVTATEKPDATANVYWTEGRCTFGSGLLLPHGYTLSSKRIAAAAVAGVKSQHARTHGKCPA